MWRLYFTRSPALTSVSTTLSENSIVVGVKVSTTARGAGIVCTWLCSPATLSRMAITGQARRIDIWLVAGAIGLSAAGDFIALIALGLNGNDMHGDGVGVALVFIALWAPIALLAGYVGLVASRKRADAVAATLRSAGVEDDALARLKAPAGLDLGPIRQEEVAVAILAELVAWRHSRTPSTPPPRRTT